MISTNVSSAHRAAIRLVLVAIAILIPIGLTGHSDAQDSTKTFRQPPLWAIVIGVNNQIDPLISDSRSSVRQADAIHNWLRDTAGWDRSHLLFLTDGGVDNPGAGEALERAFAAALREPTRDDAEIRLLRDVMNAKGDSQTRSEAIRRFNQLTAPVAAKAVEDTAFYRYGRLLSRNDVGFDPARMGMEIAEFHQRMIHRARDWPHAMLTTATHDHKRGEDVRARLAVLSDIPDIWLEKSRQWSATNTPLRGDDYAAADEYMLLQMIVGAWPVGLSPSDARGLRAFA